MNSLDQIIEIARQTALEEIHKFNSPPLILIEISNQAGQKITALLKADSQLVMLGTLLESHNLPKNQLDIVLNCIEGHHKNVEWKSFEAEICANADCYRFLTPRGIIAFLVQIGSFKMTVDESIKLALFKVEEKMGNPQSPHVSKRIKNKLHLIKTTVIVNPYMYHASMHRRIDA
jgi:hypothetical protein